MNPSDARDLHAGPSRFASAAGTCGHLLLQGRPRRSRPPRLWTEVLGCGKPPTRPWLSWPAVAAFGGRRIAAPRTACGLRRIARFGDGQDRACAVHRTALASALSPGSASLCRCLSASPRRGFGVHGRRKAALAQSLATEWQAWRRPAAGGGRRCCHRHRC